MFMILAAVPALALVWALGGKLSRLLDHEFRHVWLIWLGLGAQIVLFTPLGDWIPSAVVRAGHIGTYLPILAFLALNRSAGLSILTLGATANIVAISANGGVMPADVQAQEVIFGADSGPALQLNTDSSADNLLVLGDIMALPPWFPFANAFSIGDVLLAVGLVWALARLTVAPPGDAPDGAAVMARLVATVVGSGRVVAAQICAWGAIAAVIGQALTDGRTHAAAWAVAAGALVLLLPPALVNRAPALLAVASVGLAMCALVVDVAFTAAAVAAVASACVLIRFTSLDPSVDESDPGRLTVGLMYAATGLGLGGFLGSALGPTALLGLLGVALVIWAFVVLPEWSPVSRDPSEQAASTPSGPLAGLTLVCVAIGGAAVAAPLVAVTDLGLGARAVGAIAAAVAIGAALGIVLAAQLVRPGNIRAMGLMLVFAGMSVGLMATAHIPMTMLGAAVILGGSVGGALWLLPRPLPPQLHASGCFGVAGGASITAVSGVGSASDLLWASGVPLIAVGAIFMLHTLERSRFTREAVA